MNETRDLAAAVLQLERERDALAGQLAAERLAREAAEGRAAAAAAAVATAAGAGYPSATVSGMGGAIPAAAAGTAAGGDGTAAAGGGPRILPPYVLSDEDQRAALELRVAAYIRSRDIDVPFPLAPDEEAAPGRGATAASTAAAGGEEEAAAAAAAMETAADCLRRTVAVLGLQDVSEGYAAAAMLREAMQVRGREGYAGRRECRRVSAAAL